MAMETGLTQVLVLDDNEVFVETTLEQLGREGIRALGITSVQEFGRKARSGVLQDIKLMLFDMQLGTDKDGRKVTAADVIPVARTYTPSAKILIFTYEAIDPRDCIRCVQLGALGLVPKFDDEFQLALAARVFPNVGDPHHATEGVIKALWAQLQDRNAPNKGQLLEMLTANLLSSIDGLTLIDNNQNAAAGEVDLIFENKVPEALWEKLDSFHIVVECKNTAGRPEKAEFNHFDAKVKAHGHCRVGIMVSWNGVTSGFKERQRNSSKRRIFAMAEEDLGRLASKSRDERKAHLTSLFSRQL
jgi:CheY-like chemotaxis protein/Holliday junction resolvase-like predicted endonuclease